jgi:hypothetical protein
MKTKKLFLIPLLLIFLSCSSDKNLVVEGGGDLQVTNKWTIPVDEIFDGGPGKDGIPSIDNPVFLEADDVTVESYMDDDDLVIGIVKENVMKAYPLRILDWHEVLNDDVFGEKITISYCPLTGTAFGWESMVGGNFSEFGVSGLLYNTNLILYDRRSGSYWSQLKLECVNGKFIESVPKVVNIIETTWGLWKEMFPETKILSDKQGFSRNYGEYPYGNYKEDNSFLLFPVSKSDNSIPNKNRVHAIIRGESAKVFQFSSFGNGKAIRSGFSSDDILIVGNKKMINSYILGPQHSNLVFEYDFSIPEYYFKDNEGNKWNVLGVAVEGPRKGEILGATNSLMSYWFAIPAFFSNIEIY